MKFRRRLLSRRNYDRYWAGRDDLIERQARNLECAGLTALFSSEFRVYAAWSILRRFRLKAELQTIQSGVKPPRSKNYFPVFSNKFTRSSACSSSTARIVSINRRDVG